MKPKKISSAQKTEFIRDTVDSLIEEFIFLKSFTYPGDIECCIFRMSIYIEWLRGTVKDNAIPTNTDNG
jgi:hypothetical protein